MNVDGLTYEDKKQDEVICDLFCDLFWDFRMMLFISNKINCNN